jgi:hypothetical protein
MTDRQMRTEKAMGEAMYQLAMSMPDDKDMDVDPFSHMMDEMNRREEQLKDLTKEERILLKELCSFFDSDHNMGSNKKKVGAEVARAKEIIEQLELNVNFPVLAYGETFLNQSIYHSIDMVKMLIEMGADVNKENEMMSECALDSILEEEDENGELSDEKKAIKQLLLSKGAKAAEERWMDKADEVRRMGQL